MDKLDAIFSPQSLAVIGASTSPGKVGHDIFVNILKRGYRGTLYPVNPKARSVSSVRAYPTIADTPDSVDLAMIVLPPRRQPPIPGHWPERKVSMMPSSNNPASSGLIPSMNFSILPRPLPIKMKVHWANFAARFPTATGLPLSPMPADRVSSQRI